MIFFNFSLDKKLTKNKFWQLLLYIVLGLLILILFTGKSRVDFETIAVSQNEEFIACFETGAGHKIRCYSADGPLMFEYAIESDLSAGGFCELCFDEETLCVSFVRTDKTARLNMEGKVMDITENTDAEASAEFLGFSKDGHLYVYEGEEICVIYDRASFLGYWFFGASRQLSVERKDGQTIVLSAWKARDGES